jgi:hypothetical protein
MIRRLWATFNAHRRNTVDEDASYCCLFSTFTNCLKSLTKTIQLIPGYIAVYLEDNLMVPLHKQQKGTLVVTS